jgi:hypothetical protein
MSAPSISLTSLFLYLPGQPRRHLLQSGWSVFVSSKRLVAGDAFIFLRCVVDSCLLSTPISDPALNFCCSPCRGENGELRVGVRRAMRQLSNVPSSVISSHSMHLGVLATAWHAINTKSMFTVYYKPRYADICCILILFLVFDILVYLVVGLFLNETLTVNCFSLEVVNLCLISECQC